jgi:hypothetical protein
VTRVTPNCDAATDEVSTIVQYWTAVSQKSVYSCVAVGLYRPQVVNV